MLTLIFYSILSFLSSLSLSFFSLSLLPLLSHPPPLPSLFHPPPPPSLFHPPSTPPPPPISQQPTLVPSAQPSQVPSRTLSVQPSEQPSEQPRYDNHTLSYTLPSAFSHTLSPAFSHTTHTRADADNYLSTQCTTSNGPYHAAVRLSIDEPLLTTHRCYHTTIP